MVPTIDYGLLDRAEIPVPIFYPRPDHSAAPRGAVDHLLEVASGINVAARHYRAAGSTATFLYFHGNGEVIGDHDGIADLYHRIGVDLFVIDYRGYGKSGGQPNFESLVADGLPVAERFHAILDAHGDRGHRFLMGRSLGSHPALEIAARAPERFQGMILESAAADLRRLVARFATPADASVTEPLLLAHEAKIAGVTLPTLFLHGERDSLIPLSHAVHLRDLMKAVSPSLVVIPRAGHNDILWLGQELYFGALCDFVAHCSLDQASPSQPL
jgi:hypothetical protein